MSRNNSFLSGVIIAAILVVGINEFLFYFILYEYGYHSIL